MNDSIEGLYNDYRSNITLGDCTKLYENETNKLTKTHPDGFCGVAFDKILCWPPTPFNTTAVIKCFSEFLGIRYDSSQNATRECWWNGTWMLSNYENCKEVDSWPPHIYTQSNIYLIGFLISTIPLAIAVYIFTYFKELRCLRNIIHMNLMFSYLLTYLFWMILLIDFNYREKIGFVCTLIVAILHYFHLTTFFWMFVEGLYLYILVVHTLTRESFKLRVYFAIGWGVPLLVVIVWASTKSIFTSTPYLTDACIIFLVSDLDMIFQAPTMAVLIMNIIFMISIMVVLVTKLRSANTLEIQQYRKALKALSVLIPLLGVTYAITLYAPVNSMWDLARSVLLSLQGCMVALFYCFMNSEVQNTLKHHFRNWKTKKSLRPNRLRSSSRSKDWSPRSRTESLRITECTIVSGDEDLDDDHYRHSGGHLHSSSLSHTKESLLSNRKESFSQQFLRPTNNARRFSNESAAIVHDDDANSLGQGRKCNSDIQVNRGAAGGDSSLTPNRDLLCLSQRKESLVHQPLLEQSEDSPTSDQTNVNGSQQQRVGTKLYPDIVVNAKGESMVVAPRGGGSFSKA